MFYFSLPFVLCFSPSYVKYCMSDFHCIRHVNVYKKSLYKIIDAFLLQHVIALSFIFVYACLFNASASLSMQSMPNIAAVSALCFACVHRTVSWLTWVLSRQLKAPVDGQVHCYNLEINQLDEKIIQKTIGLGTTT